MNEITDKEALVKFTKIAEEEWSRNAKTINILAAARSKEGEITVPLQRYLDELKATAISFMVKGMALRVRSEKKLLHELLMNWNPGGEAN